MIETGEPVRGMRARLRREIRAIRSSGVNDARVSDAH
jgi:hypothetical protein